MEEFAKQHGTAMISIAGCLIGIGILTAAFFNGGLATLVKTWSVWLYG